MRQLLDCMYVVGGGLIILGTAPIIVADDGFEDNAGMHLADGLIRALARLTLQD